MALPSEVVTAVVEGFDTPCDLAFSGASCPRATALTMFPCSAVDSVDLARDAVGIDLSTDGRFVLVTRHPVGDEEDEAVTVVATYDADTLDWVRDSASAICESEPCDTPPPTPMTVAIDAAHAFTSEPGTGKIAYVYLDAPPNRFASSLLETVIEATRDDAWVTVGAKTSTLELARTGRMLFELAGQASSEEARKALVRQGAEKLQGVKASVDGCFGGGGSDDLVTSCYEAAGIWNVAVNLLAEMSRDLVDPPEVP